jgi:WD40 repeat protein
VWSASFSPDGARIVTASNDGTARLWDATTGEEIIGLRHEGSVSSAPFPPDGARIVTASEDGLRCSYCRRRTHAPRGMEVQTNFRLRPVSSTATF